MPVVPYGGIYDIPEVTVKPDPELEYRLVIDVVSGADHPDSLAAGLYNVARMLNLFSVGGVPDEQVDVVLAIHGGATVAVLDDLSYRQRFGTDNPNLPLIRALKGAGVRVTVCGQSLIGRTIDPASVTEEVEIATSMLTTVAMYQMRGYGLMRF
jgi:intracellular sulfur oxidation DsrE/DsrF family protein